MVKNRAFLVLLHFLIIPCAIMVIAKLIWGTEMYSLLGLIGFFAWIYIYGGPAVTKAGQLRREKEEQYSNNLIGEENRGISYGLTMPTGENRYNKKALMLRCKMWLHSFIIPCLFFITFMELWYPAEIIFLGLFAGMGWMYFLGGRLAKKFIELKKENK